MGGKNNDLLLVKVKGLVNDESLNKIKEIIQKGIEKGVIVYPDDLIEINIVKGYENVRFEKERK